MRRRGGIVILDLQGDHWGLKDETNEFYGFPISEDIFLTKKIDWVGVLKKYPYLIVSPKAGFDGEQYGALGDEIAGAIMEIGNRTFVIEEAQFAMPVKTSIQHNLAALITTGRKLGIDLYFTTQRPAFVSTTAIAQANTRITFLVDDVNDLKRLQPYFPKDDLTKLQRFHFAATNNFNHDTLVGDNNHLSQLDKIVWPSGIIESDEKRKQSQH